MKIAIVADWLTNFGGDIQVILSLKSLFPEAPIFTTLYNPKALPQFRETKVVTSFLQNWPQAQNRHQFFIPFMPMAIEELSLKGFDLVISSSHTIGKGVIVEPGTFHISYCHTPVRWAWEPQIDNLKERISLLPNFIIKRLINYFQKWDYLASQRVDLFIANSKTTEFRIKNFYKKEATLLHPPVETDYFKPNSQSRQDYFLTGGRLIPYKRTDLVVQAFNQNQLPLKIVGKGPEQKRLKNLARSNKIEFLGEVEKEELKKLYTGAQGFIFAGIEDFGIVMAEAEASGTPVLAYRGGGATEIVEEGKSGLLFDEQTVKSLNQALKKFQKIKFLPKKARTSALRFSRQNFEKQFLKIVNANINK